MPFNKNVAIKFNRSTGSIIGNILWLIFGLNFVYLIVCGIFYVIFRITIVGYPLAVQCVKIMKFLCAPFGAEIVEDGQFSKNKDTAYDQGLIESATLRFAMENTELADQLLEDMDDKNLDHIYNAAINSQTDTANPLPAICKINNNYPFSSKYENLLPKKFRREKGNKIGKSLIFAFLGCLAILILGILCIFLPKICFDGIGDANASLIILLFSIMAIWCFIFAIIIISFTLCEVLFERDFKYRVYTSKYLYLMNYLDDKIIDKYIANKETTINGSYVVEDLKNISPQVDAAFAGQLLKRVKRRFAVALFLSVFLSIIVASFAIFVIINLLSDFDKIIMYYPYILWVVLSASIVAVPIRLATIFKSAEKFLNGFIKK